MWISIDLGGTIEDTWQEKRAWFASRGIDFGPRPLSRSEIVIGSGVTEALYGEMVTSVYSDAHILTHTLVAGCYEALMAISAHFSIIVLSSRGESQSNITLQWLQQNALLPMVSEVALIGHNENKLLWCRDRNVSILVDDDIRHLKGGDDNMALIKIHYTGCISQPCDSGHKILRASHWANVAELVASFGRFPHNLGSAELY